jgi:hypothetical protein
MVMVVANVASSLCLGRLASVNLYAGQISTILPLAMRGAVDLNFANAMPQTKPLPPLQKWTKTNGYNEDN